MLKLLLSGLCILLSLFIPKPSFAVGPLPLSLPPQKDLSRPQKIKGIYISGWTAGSKKKFAKILELIEETELNALVIDIKDSRGNVTYNSQIPRVKEVNAAVDMIEDLPGLLKKLKERDIYPIARLVCFKDPLLSQAYPEMALKTKEGSIWKDNKETTWLDPYNQKGWEYLVDLSKEAIKLGFKEVQFDYVRFPTDRNKKYIHYGKEAQGKTKAQAIADFLAYARSELAPLGAVLSADIYGIVLTHRKEGEEIGQDFMKIAEHVDYISPMIYPSHYANVGQNGTGQLINEVLFKYPDLEPYGVVYNTLFVAQKKLHRSQLSGRIRPWLQAFTASYLGKDRYQEYNGEQIKEQIRAAYDAGIEEWLLWNPKNRYSADGLAKESGEGNKLVKNSENPGPESITD